MLKKILIALILVIIILVVIYLFFYNKQGVDFLSNLDSSKYSSISICKQNKIDIFNNTNITGCGEVVSVENNLVTIRSGTNKVVLYSDGYALLGKYNGDLFKNSNIDFSNSDTYSTVSSFKPNDIVFYVYQENNNNTIQQLTKLN